MIENIYPPLIRQIKSLLPPSSWPWVLTALRLDDLIWESLCNYEAVFGVTELSELIRHPDDCAPAALSLKALRYPRTPQELRVLPLIPVEPAFREKVESIETLPIHKLSDAAILALNLRQKRHTTGSWNDWTDTLENTPLTALASTFGIIPDQIEFLQALLPAQLEDGRAAQAIERLLKVILTNPAPFSVQIELIRLLLGSLSPSERELLLQALTVIQPTLAKSLPMMSSSQSTSMSNQKEGALFETGMLNQVKTFASQLTRAIKIFDQGATDLKAQQLSQSIQLTAEAQALMLVKLAIISEINSAEREAEAHWQNALRLQPNSETLKAIYLLRQGCAYPNKLIPLNEEITPLLEPDSDILSFSFQCLKPQHEQNSADLQCNNNLVILAQNVLNKVKSLAQSDPFLSDQEIFEYFLALISQLLLQRGMNSVAQKALSLLLSQKPNHPFLLSLMAILLHAQGYHPSALNLLHLMEGLFSDQAALKSLLAQSHAANHEWESALQIWQTLLESSPTSQSWNAEAQLTLYEMLACARFAGKETLVIELCKKKLESSPQDGILLSLLAEINTQQDLIQRIENHQKAIQLCPSEAYVWLAYARTAKNNNDLQKAMEILNAAEQTLPKNPCIQSALGELFLELGQPSLALPHLKAAAETFRNYKHFSLNFTVQQFLVDVTNLPNFLETINLRFNADWGSTAITFDQWYGVLIARLGETLQSLGHRDQAHEVLEAAISIFPANPDITHQLARLNMEEGKYGIAGELLRTILSQNNLYPQVVVDFASCALEDENVASLDEVILLLQDVLESQPEYFEGLALLAKAFGRSNRPSDALKLYDQIFRFPQAQQQPLRGQLALEMGQIALQSAEYELALTTLLECDQENPLTQKALAETYLNLKLYKEATQAAQNTRSCGKDDLDTLIWYANFSTRLADADPSHELEYLSSVIGVLQQALESYPQRNDLKLALAEALYRIGDQTRTKEILLAFIPEIENSSPLQFSENELIRAAQYLYLVGEQAAALSCYEKSLSMIKSSSPEEHQKLNEIYQIMAEIHRQYHNYSKLEQVLKQAIALNPDDLNLFFDYLSAWLEVYPFSIRKTSDHQNIDDLIILFEHQRKQCPDSKELMLLYGLFLRWIGESEKAIEILNQIITDIVTTGETASILTSFDLYLISVTELSRIYRSRGEYDMADFWLDEGRQKTNSGVTPIKKDAIEFFCDWIEVALGRGEDCESLLIDLCDNNPNYLRLIALMCHVKLNLDDLMGAKLLFETSIKAITEPLPPISSFHPAIEKLLDLSRRLETLYTTSKVAQKIGQWNLACELLNQAIRLEPEGTRAHWERLRAFVLRAEYQRICQFLEIETNAPGNMALEDEAKTDFDASAQFLQNQYSHLPKEYLGENGKLREWLYRGQLVFYPSGEENIEPDEEIMSVETLGAYLMTAAKSDIGHNLSISAHFQAHPFVQFCIALTTLELQPQWAAQMLENSLNQITSGETLSIPRDHWILSSKHFIALLGIAYAKSILMSALSNNEEAARKWSDAQKVIENSLEYYPDEAKWRILAAQIAAQDTSSQASLLKAIDHLEQALKYDCQSMDAFLRLAKLYLTLQKTDLAIQYLEKASDLDAANSEIDYWLAKAYLQRHQFEPAAQYAQSAINKNPLEVKNHILRGEIALNTGDTATAIQLLKQALELFTKSPELWILYARALHASGKTYDALRVLDKTFPLNTEFLNHHLERIELLQEWQGAEAALPEVNLLLEAFPHSGIVHLRKAKILAELGEVESAINSAQCALRQCHQSPLPVSFQEHALSHRLLGELFYRSGHLDQAVYHINEAISLFPNDEAAYLILADIYLSRNEKDRALVAYQRCLSLNPENSRALFNAGVLYKEFKDYQNAEQMLRQAARLEPTNLAIQRQLGAVIALNLIHTRKTREKHNL